MPPRPITGISTALATSWTILKATGLTAGPDTPAYTLLNTAFLLYGSIANPFNVLISDNESAPASWHFIAISTISSAFGDNLTIRGLSTIALAFLTTS